MNLPTDSQWTRYSLLCRHLEPLPTSEREAVLHQLYATGDEDPQVLSLVALHYALPPDPTRDRTGDRLGDFTLEEPLGAGGMGVVYRAQQHIGATTRPVAVKLIHPSWLQTAQAQALAQFQAELGTLVKLEHESIARIYGGGIVEDPITHESLPYIAMELVRGGLPLTTYVQDHALAWQECLTLFLRVCRAVQYAHEHRILHRDLKPANILVDSEGHPFVIDFGLARAYDEWMPGGVLVSGGTPAYMSPEQVADGFGALSAKTDVYALGLILYELLTGQLPYTLPPAFSWTQLRDIITTAIPPSLGQHRPEYDEEIDALLTSALAKRPADRCSVAVLRARLERVLHEGNAHMAGVGASLIPPIPSGPALRQVPAPPLRRRGAAPWPKVAFGLVGLLLILGGGVVGWRLFPHPSWPTADDPAQQIAALALPDKPSIAVLPFVNKSDDPGQEYFSNGMTEDLITDLTRLRGLFVIAQNSVFTYKGKPVKPEQVSRELGVRYILEGSVRKANDRVRITVQLVDATTGYHLWAARYDRDLQDIFAVQEEIARKITRALAVRLTREEAEHMGRPYTDSVVAWEYFMRGAELYRRYTKKDNAQARELFERAISLDPEFARAYATLAATHRQDWSFAWTQDPHTSEELAYRLAQDAVELSRREIEPQPSLPYALQQWAYVLLYRRRHHEASVAVEEAVQRNPNYVDGYAVWAQVLIYMGQPQVAIDKMKIAMRLNPKYPAYYDFHVGQAYYVEGFLNPGQRQHYETAETHLREALKKSQNFRPARSYLVVVLSELGRQDEAVHEMAIQRDMGRPQAFQDLQRFQEYVQQVAPYENEAITTRLGEIWQAAESRP